MKKSKKLITLLTALLLTSCNSVNDDSTLTIYCWSISSINTAKKTNSPIYQKIKENTNADIIAKTINSSAYEEAINKLFNTEELPDVFVTYGPERPNQYKKMIENGTLLAISDYVSETKYKNLYKHLQNYKFLEDLYYVNHKQYSIPTNFSLEHSIYVREDWIENLNKKEKLTQILTDELGHTPSEEELSIYKFKDPTTILEFYRLARAFTFYDPDENGINDTYGYTSTSDMWSDNFIYNAFAGGYQMMVKDNDKYNASIITNNTKKAVSFINKMHNEGIMHPDWQTDTFDDKQTKFCQGKVGIIECHNWFNNIIVGFRSANPNISIEKASQIIKMINPPTNENGMGGISSHPNFWTVTCINAKMSKAKIEKALTLMDYLYSKEGQDLFVYGIEGIHYEMKDNERVSLMGKNNSGFNYTVASYDAAYPFSNFCNWTADYFSPYATNASLINKQMEEAKKYSVYEDHPFVQTPKYVSYFEGMNDYSEEKFNEFITGDKYYNNTSNKLAKVGYEDLYSFNDEFNSNWNAYVNIVLNDYKGQEVIDEYNQYLNGNN